MPVGFLYIVATAKRDYMQQSFRNVPTEFEGRIYFGPCKMQMRPKMQPGDYVIGISPAGERPRRILFVTQVEERITFAQAYERFPGLRGPQGPIHVRPVAKPARFYAITRIITSTMPTSTTPPSMASQ